VLAPDDASARRFVSQAYDAYRDAQAIAREHDFET